MRALISAIKLLTILPIDTRNRIAPGAVGWTLLCFPFVGLLLGGVCAGIFWAAAGLFPLTIAAALAILALVTGTGALHVDGLADTADGLFGGHTRERKLEIMRDSRIGTFGVVAIVFLLGLKVLTLGAVAGISKDIALSVLVVMPMAGRWAVLLAAGLCGYAREGEGTGRAFIEGATVGHFAACAPIVAACSWLILGPGGLAMLGMLLIATPLMIFYVNSKIGGMTGDTLGAVCELGELVFLLSFFISVKVNLVAAA